MCVSDFEIVATEEVAPYHSNGRPFLHRTKEGSAVRETILKYNGPFDCIEANGDEQKNIITIPWRDMYSFELSVCLFRIASSLRSIEKIIRWIETEGFTDIVIRDNPSSYTSPVRKKWVRSIRGSWDLETHQAKYPIFWFWLDPSLYKGSGVTVKLDAESNVISAYFSTTAILN